MRILVDTNILISAILFPNSVVAKTLLYVVLEHNMVLCSQNICEFKAVIMRKKPSKVNDVLSFLEQISYELIPDSTDLACEIRDVKDQPILNAAINADVDIILTGDKDFLSLGLERPRCVSVREFRKLLMLD